jgi:hypothetical protein
MAVNDKIGSNDITVAMGDITAIKADAYVIPQFPDGLSYSGVAEDVARAGGATRNLP